MDSALNVQLLGEFRLSFGDELLRAAYTPRLKSLLAYLLLHRNAPQSRRHLAYLYWPDSTEDQAHNNLRQSFHRLRQALPYANRYLYGDTQSIQWVPDSLFTLDVEEFEKAVECANEIDTLKYAANLYHGELLPDCYDDWILAERERLQQTFQRVLDRLIPLLENQKEYRLAIYYAERLLRSDPLSEETYRQLIRLYFHSGDRPGAIRTYHACVQVLKRELDVDPSAETEKIYRESQKSPGKPVGSARSKGSKNNLPTYLTRFIGREGELEQLKSILTRRTPNAFKARLITLTGPGGCGKTRLAVQVAGSMIDEYQDGIWFIDIANLTAPDLLPNAVAFVLDIHEYPETDLLLAIGQSLQAKECLLILDNCESMTSACANVIQSLSHACPQIQFLVTSREKLNLDGEYAWPVAPLSLPDGKDTSVNAIARSDAVRLFIERATSALPTFTINQENAGSISQICRRLDGLPLAIELAAARVAMLTTAQIAFRLETTFHLLARASPSTPLRHQTLQATMDWSYNMLSAKERILFQRLSVFSGSFTLEEVETVCADREEQGYLPVSEILDLLARLLDKSMICVSDWKQGDQLRYRLLRPTWQYADEKLRQSGDWMNLRQRHLDYFTYLSEGAERHLIQSEQVEWFDRLLCEHDNLMAAIQWSLQLEDLTHALHLLATLWYYWLARGYYQEGLKLLVETLDSTRAEQPTGARASALQAAGSLYFWSQNDCSRARPLLEEAVEVSKRLGTQRTLAGSLSTLGAVALGQEDYASAYTFLMESLSLYDLDDRHGMGWSCAYLGDLFMLQNNLHQAFSYFEKSMDHFRAIGDMNSLAYPTRRSGVIAITTGDLEKAIALFKESLRMNLKVNYIKGTAACLVALARVAFEQEDFLRSANLIGAAEKMLNATSGKMFPTDQAEYERVIAALSIRMEPVALQAARADGQASKAEAFAE